MNTAYPELRRLASDAGKNPDLLFGLLNANGSIQNVVDFANKKGYAITEGEFEEIAKNSEMSIKLAREYEARAKNDENRPSAIALVVIVVAVFIWVYPA